jgi:hypothetical protein
MIDSDILEKLNYIYNDTYELIHDFDLNIRLFDFCIFDYVDSIVLYRRQHDDNYSNKDYSIQIKEMQNWILNNNDKYANKLLHLFKENIYLLMFFHELKNRNFFKSLTIFFKLPLNKKLTLLYNKFFKIFINV